MSRHNSATSGDTSSSAIDFCALALSVLGGIHCFLVRRTSCKPINLAGGSRGGSLGPRHANGCYIAATNRVGTEGRTQFWGQSFVSDPYGEIVARADCDREEVLVADCDLAKQREFRRIWPFFRDRRIDAYGDLTRRLRD